MSDLLELEESDVQERFFGEGWTDGLPIVPPTPKRVTQMLAAGGLDPTAELGRVADRDVTITAEQVAIQAVMAGCRAEYFPIVVAAARAFGDPAFNASAAATSTGGAALCVIVSGPLAHQLGIKSGLNALGSGTRANATIGRTMRLLAINALGACDGGLDASSLGHPGKYSFCFAEEPPPAPWEPLRVTLGFDESDTTVMLAPTEGSRQIANFLSSAPEDVLLTCAATMRDPATYPVGKSGVGILVLGYEHRMAVIGGGWTRRRAQEFLAERTRISPEELRTWGLPLETSSTHRQVPEEDGKLPSFRSPDDILIVTAGGPGAGWSAYVPLWAPPSHSHARPVTYRVEPPA